MIQRLIKHWVYGGFIAICFYADIDLLPAKPAEPASFSSPESLVADLYKQENAGHSPFFQTKQRGLLDRYFTAQLSCLIWKDTVTSQAHGEVGALDGDPLYDAQDMEITHFALRAAPAHLGKGEATVIASFKNMGHKTKVIYSLLLTKTGWRISDITYGDGRTLVGILSEK